MEIGEPVAIPSGSPSDQAKKKDKKGHLEVEVVDTCNGNGIEGAEVSVFGHTATTDANGVARFKDIVAKKYKVWAQKAYKQADYFKFTVHYPRIVWRSEAKDRAAGIVAVEENKTASLTLELTVFRCLDKMVLKRKHIELSGSDKYGHWWTEIDDVESYGWWPKYPMGHPAQTVGTPPTRPTAPGPSAGILEKLEHQAALVAYEAEKKLYEARNHPLSHTLRGVEGELNGQTAFGGSPTKDPHHGDGKADGVKEMYQPVLDDCRPDSSIKAAARVFAAGYATAYGGGWSWRFEGGNHCHTFQIRLVKHCGLDKFKEL